MESMESECQSAAADSTTAAASIAVATTTTTTTAASENFNIQQKQQQQQQNAQSDSSHSIEPQVSSTTTLPPTSSSASSHNVVSTSDAAPQNVTKIGSPPPAVPNNNNNNSKIKLQQQQQQQHFHQFRAPQQFVRQRRTAAVGGLTKNRNKAWNKRQNKTTKQQQQQQHHNLASLAAAAAAGAGVLIVGGSGSAGGGGAVGGNLSGSSGNVATTKADLENIQIFKHQYYHHYRGGGGGNGGGGGGTVEGRAAGNVGLPPSALAGLEKLGYGHGHLKQQLYKKMLAHRGGHHHVLCAGAAHNTLGGIGSGLPNPNCCLVNGCTGGSQNGGKDSSSKDASNVSQSLHYCCGRSKFFLPDKRIRKEVIIPPTKFLLGGNISDPLNLNSLQNDSSNASSNNNTPATTPRQSPITTPPKVEVIIPPNIHDPLHLLDPVDSMEYEKQLTSPMKRQRHHSHHHKQRHRKHRKPKRRRYESYNSTSSSVTGLELDERNASVHAGSNSSTEATTLSISTLLDNSQQANNNNNNSSQCSSNTAASANVSAVSGSLNVAAPGALELSAVECEEQTLDLRVGEERTEMRNMSPLLSASGVGAGTGSAAELLNVGTGAAAAVVGGGAESMGRERASRDLRLELNSTASGSTCGSVMGAGGRKRKISESNNSQKNKKFHRLDSMDKIVSPVVPQPGAWKRPPRLAATGARKPARRSTSVSETEVLSPADELPRPLTAEVETLRVETPDLTKQETISEAGLGSPLSTISGTTSIAAGEQESIADTSVGENTTSLLGDESTVAHPSTSMQGPSGGPLVQLTKAPKFRAEDAKYRYGNYDRYVGFRHLNEFMDVRLQVFQRHIELFQNKDILDIGCNVGHMAITLARNLAPKSILGIDIDKELIARARKNLSLYVLIPPEPIKKEEPVLKIEKPKSGAEGAVKIEPKVEQEAGAVEVLAAAKKPKKTRRKKRKGGAQQQSVVPHHFHHHHHHLHYHHHQQQMLQQLRQKLHVPATELFPVSFPLMYGSIPPVVSSGDAHSPSGSTSTPGHASNATPRSSGGQSKRKNEFPRNVFFRQMNYVLKDESQLANDTQQYDLILCLSVTKWIHLNFGDAGLKLAFKRMFNQLRPGGKLILEAQNWASYKKKKNLTKEIYDNYRNIEFFPNKFHEYLLSSEVGFSHSYTLGVPRHLNKGFCRPIQLYAKGDYTPNHVRWSDAYYPQTPYEAYRGIYATMPPRPAGVVNYAMSSTRSQAYDTPHYTGNQSGPYSCRQTPMYQPTSQYYNPLETDSYLPSYDMEYLNHMYVFASPLYQTVWSPPASLRNSSSHTPVFGSVRDAELDGEGSGGGGGGSYHRHVYPPNEDTSSPNANAGGAFSSIRDADTDDSNQLPASNVQHVYATNCGESSSSPQVQHHDSETIDESLIMDEENVNVGSGSGGQQQPFGGDMGEQ